MADYIRHGRKMEKLRREVQAVLTLWQEEKTKSEIAVICGKSITWVTDKLERGKKLKCQ